uniref:Uncharacterized protein n=1 Tax=Marseillevirus LCMAC202 TaxID=2506606 RepID=A0A481YYA8_9VIRU|nr:MAG: hypothetical protein LCMAC202_03410 [Marseillevirus LCMAC202]
MSQTEKPSDNDALLREMLNVPLISPMFLPADDPLPVMLPMVRPADELSLALKLKIVENLSIMCFRYKYLITANGEREMNKEDYPPLMRELARVCKVLSEKWKDEAFDAATKMVLGFDAEMMAEVTESAIEIGKKDGILE